MNVSDETNSILDEASLRAALLAATLDAEARGLNHNSTGNLSIRCGHDILVTPSGIPASQITPDDLVLVRPDGAPCRPGQRTPTSEMQLHLAIYMARPELAAIVHTHSPEATSASCLGRAIGPVHYVVARFGGAELRCAPYATYGSVELATQVTATLGTDGHGCLMAHHGAIAVGPDLDTALSLAHDIEWFCTVARRARQWGATSLLPRDEISKVASRFATYGQPEIGAPADRHPSG